MKQNGQRFALLLAALSQVPETEGKSFDQIEADLARA